MDNSLSKEVQHLREHVAELEAALQESRQRERILQDLIDSMPEVMYASDTNGVLQAANHAFFQWVGLPPDRVIGKQQSELFPADLVAYWQSQMDQVRESGQIVSVEEQVAQGDETVIYLSQRFPMRDQAGEIYAVAGTARDITLQKQTELALKTNQHILRAIIDNAPAVIFVKNTQGRLIVVNRLYARVLGKPVEEIMGKTEIELFPEDLVAEWRQSDQNIFETGEAVHFQNTMPLDGEMHDFLTVQFPLYDDENKPFAICGISTDVSDLRRAERERARFQEEIIRVQEAALRELSTPLIPIADDILVMPLIGAMDSRRAQQVLETLLEGVVHHSADRVILDLTGLTMIDDQITNFLIHVAKATRLLGAEITLTGVGPEVAQNLVSIGADLQGITIAATLQSSISSAFRERA